MTIKPKRLGVPDDLRDLYKRVRILEALNAGINGQAAFETYSGCVLARPSLQYFYVLDDAVGSSVAADSADSNDATRFGGGSGDYPIFGQTGVFAGLPDETSCAFKNNGQANPYNPCRFEFAHSSTFFGSTSAWTIEMYVYPTLYGGVTGAGAHLFESWSGSAGQATSIFIGATGDLSAARGVVGTGGTAAENAPLNEWTLLRVTYDGATLKIFVNDMDTPTDSDATATALAGNTLASFGNNRNTGGTGYRPFDGNLAYVSIYDEAITGSCDTAGTGGGPCSPVGMVPTTDGACGWSWQYPTIEVEF